MMIFADQRYNRADRRNKLPRWIGQYLDTANINLSTDSAVHIARDFFKQMAQPRSTADEMGHTLLSLAHLQHDQDHDTGTINKFP